jgi:3-dehydroquinate synthase
MQNINIKTGSKIYSVRIGHGVINDLKHFLKDNFNQVSKVMIITDMQVGNLHLATLSKVLNEYEYCTYITPNGEAAKTFDVYYQAMTFALEHRLDRNAILLAFGGGAVGDLGGFVASTFMRGIPFIQIPTTILAHDSAVGGKVAINHPIGKNMIGSFYQPEAVFYDLDFINTLSIKEKRSGFAELIKHSLIDDADFYNELFNNIQSLETLNSQQLQPLLVKGINVKAKIVSNDEKELGQRAFLNFGHTLGHAIEAESGYGNITHGEAVAIGMVFALKLSIERLNLPFNLVPFTQWLDKLGYLTYIPSNLSRPNLVKRMKQDKKAVNDEIRMILLANLGQPVIESISENDIFTALEKM